MKLHGKMSLKTLDKGFANLEHLAERAAHVNVGLGGNDEKVFLYGKVHEFGSANVPQRSFVRSTVENNNPKYRQVLRGILVTELASALKGAKSNSAGQLDQLGRQAAADIRAKIKSNIGPALQPETISRKKLAGYPQPTTALIATGKLMASVTHEVIGSKSHGKQGEGGGHHG